MNVYIHTLCFIVVRAYLFSCSWVPNFNRMQVMWLNLCYCWIAHVHFARAFFRVFKSFWRSLMYWTAKSNMSDVLVCLSMSGKRACIFFILSLIRVLLTLSAMLRGCVAHPLLARALQRIESCSNRRNFSAVAISEDVFGKLIWWTKLGE